MSTRCTKQLSDGRWVAWQGTVLVESRTEDAAHDRLDVAVADGQDRDEDNKIVGLLNLLREGEGHYVTVLCPNADFYGPAQAVLAFGEWTGWDDRRFEGETLLEALDAAVGAMLGEPEAPPDAPSPLPDAANRFLGALVSLIAFGVPDSNILSALIGTASTTLGLLLEEDPAFMDRMRENRPENPPATAAHVDQVLEGLAAIHRLNAEKAKLTELQKVESGDWWCSKCERVVDAGDEIPDPVDCPDGRVPYDPLDGVCRCPDCGTELVIVGKSTAAR